MTVTNALTFDVEEWFHVNSLQSVDECRRGAFESLVVPQTEKVLSILKEKNVGATFFVLGCIAEKHPGLVKKISDQGHEVASHGYGHKLVCDMELDEFAEDLVRSLDAIEKACGFRPVGYRAPNYSVTKDCLWALDVLKENGLSYDSSVYPNRIIHKDPITSPDKPYVLENGLHEFPGPTTSLFGMQIPFGGGVFFRNLPYWFTKKSVKTANKKGIPVTLYLHPWELDPNHPRIKCGLKPSLIHYCGLEKTEGKLSRLFEDFSFKPVSHLIP